MFWLVALIVVAGLAVAGGKGTKWKLVNLAIILAFAGVGFGIGYSLGTGVSLPLSVSVGAAGAAGYSVWHQWRTKEGGAASKI